MGYEKIMFGQVVLASDIPPGQKWSLSEYRYCVIGSNFHLPIWLFCIMHVFLKAPSQPGVRVPTCSLH